MENLEKNDLIIIEPTTGEISVSQKVDNFLDQLNSYKSNIDEKEKEFREIILENMKKCNVLSIRTEKYLISKVTPSPTIEFDTNKFIEESDPFLTVDYVTYQKEVSIDIDRLLHENPELKERYTVVKEVPNVDLKKLANEEPEIYNKYATITPSKKPCSLRIMANKEGK